MVGGRLTRDPETKQVGDNEVTSFAVAVNPVKQDDPAAFYECSCWGKRGVVIANHFAKGKPIVVWGPVRMDSWEANNGETRHALRVTVDGFSFAGDTRDDKPANNAAGKSRAGSRSKPDADYGQPVNSDDIPF